MSTDHSDLPRHRRVPPLVVDPDELVVEVRTGPAVVEPQVLGPGRHLIGRAAHCALHIPDPGIEPHHLLIEVEIDGSIRLRQLTGRLIMRVDGVAMRRWPAGAATTVDAASVDAAGLDVELGATRLRIRRRPVRFDPPTHRIERGGRIAVLRRPRSAVPSASAMPPEVGPPSGAPFAGPGRGPSDGFGTDEYGTAPPATAGIIGALGGAVSAAVIAAVTRQVLFVIIAATALGISILTTVFQRLGRARRRRRRRRERELAHAEHLAALERTIDRHRRALIERYLERVPPLGAALAVRHGSGLWARRLIHDDALLVSLGEGSIEIPLAESLVTAAAETPELVWRAAQVDDAPIPLDLRAHSIVAVAGAFAAPVVRSLMIQSVIASGPADVMFAVVTERSEHYDWCRPLPHLAAILDRDDIGSRPAVIEGLRAVDGDDGPHLVVVTDDVDAMADAASPLRRRLAGAPRTTVIVEVAEAGVIPTVADGVLYTGLAAAGRWCPEVADAPPQRLRIAGLERSTARRIAAEFADLVDPETGSSSLVERVDLDEIEALPTSIDAVIDRWRRGSRRPAARIGLGADGRVMAIDLVGDGPHALVAGTTGSGKSELLRTMVMAMALESAPCDVNFILIDYKGGATFDRLSGLPHIVGVITDLDEQLAERAVVSLGAELRRREHLLRAVGAVDLEDHRRMTAGRPHETLARLVVVVDEFAALVADVPGFVPALVALAQRGRSLGIHLILATQRPAGVIDDHIRANTDLRIALRLNDVADALDVVGSSEPARFARTTPGRALITCGGAAGGIAQTARCGAGLDALVGLVAAAGRSPGSGGANDAIAVAHRPWLEPLGDLDASVMAIDGLPRAIGVIDDPERQCREPLCWSGTEHLALVGSPRSGVGTALVEVVRAEARTAPDGVRLALIDAAAAGFRRLSSHSVLVDDRERLRRLLVRLVQLIEQRRADIEMARTRFVLAVDGWLAVRREIEADDELARALDRILSDGPSVGVCVVATLEVDGPRTAAALGRFTKRWIFRLEDPADAPLYGIAAADSPRPGELTIVGCGRRARIMCRDDTPIPDSIVEPLSVLSSTIRLDPRELRCGPASSAGSTRLRIGTWYDDLDPAMLEVAEGDHLMVLGPPRSGRSSALHTIAGIWRASRPGARVIEIDAHHRLEQMLAAIENDEPSGARDPVECPVADLLVVIDDAERLDDPSGRFATWLEQRVPGRLVVAAGRADILRSAYGHWSAVMRRSRCGIVMSATPDVDADLLGIAPPRRCPIAPRPGLGWAIGHGPTRLVQIAQLGSRASGGSDRCA